MVFHWSLSESPQVSRTHLSILAVLNNAVIWMVFTRLPTSNSSSPFSNPLAIFTNPSARAGYDTRSIFKRSLTGFNSEFSFS